MKTHFSPRLRRAWHRPERATSAVAASVAGYSLIELLAVMAIISVMAMGMPALRSVMNSYSLKSAGQAIQAQLSYARQEALTSNRAVQVRLYKVSDSENPSSAPQYRAMQSFRETTDASGTLVLTPISPVTFLPSGIVFTDTVTAAATLFATGTSGATVNTTGDTAWPLPPPHGASPFLSFRFRSNGQTDLSASSFFTIVPTRAPIVKNELPANFITFQIDSINGAVRAWQPGS
ncbi:hypothetical protein DB346_01575 [Verrucomicrobia bacterium LW23]|nr:hypothetical protein DB346_01575 [Verrucomicrobia bacterium LW23]